MTNHYTTLRHAVTRLEDRASAFLFPEDPLPWLDGLDDEGFLEILVPTCQQDAEFYISPSAEPDGYDHTFRRLSLKVIAAAHAGRFTYAKQLFRLQTRLSRYRYRGNWKVMLRDLRAALADAPSNVGASLA